MVTVFVHVHAIFVTEQNELSPAGKKKSVLGGKTPVGPYRYCLENISRPMPD